MWSHWEAVLEVFIRPAVPCSINSSFYLHLVSARFEKGSWGPPLPRWGILSHKSLWLGVRTWFYRVVSRIPKPTRTSQFIYSYAQKSIFNHFCDARCGLGVRTLFILPSDVTMRLRTFLWCTVGTRSTNVVYTPFECLDAPSHIRSPKHMVPKLWRHTTSCHKT